ncbi:MAG TPA: RNA polymerase-binding protein RbpA [Candidatus Yaniella excrementigallinarum]|nr:RNA polymerase-binding protein RbpA [Candidatus Yaniella excrementigallinarum]
MSDRSLRGMRLGAQSMETEAGVEPAPRQQVEYRSEDGESIVVTFAAEADVPDRWTTKSGKEALRVDGEAPDLEEVKAQRSHWDMLLERRSVEELEETLEGQLKKLRIRRGEEVEA